MSKQILQEVRVFSPATVANVACGFDVLGFDFRGVAQSRLRPVLSAAGRQGLRALPPDVIVPPHRHPWAQLAYPIRGAIRICAAGMAAHLAGAVAARTTRPMPCATWAPLPHRPSTWGS